MTKLEQIQNLLTNVKFSYIEKDNDIILSFSSIKDLVLAKRICNKNNLNTIINANNNLVILDGTITDLFNSMDEKLKLKFIAGGKGQQ